MINNVVLVGRLTKDVELRYTGNGIAVGTFTMAINRSFTNAQGEHEADFIQCVIWRKSAENFANFTHKGSLVGIQGRIQTRNYENQQGQRVYVTEVVADNFSLLEPKGAGGHSNNSGSQSNGGGYNGGASNGGSNFNNNYNQNNSNNNNAFNSNPGKDNNGGQSGNSNATDDPFANSSEPMSITDDDLPF
ncbi:single-stranded DNA-binding protein [Lapidilactobacillus achengensis]|uniref:Single-stranded DNA-binding protein n=1 Tax=Lapidilactobacillus achengensis TaxID=2486000 RepID=A0ABW1UMM0_9LACO|nr:single-stranded DNA-binding protein [Lapidilactobacillus achengensis]